jgi:uncharacterized protein (AIM24 family)/DNA-directed RNA polymerase subunit RPC12/RpoP
MAVYFCQSCSHQQPVTNDYLGKVANCPKCGKRNKIIPESQATGNSTTANKTQTKVVAGATTPQSKPQTSDGRYNLDQFLNKTIQKDKGQGFFELESDRILEINLQGNSAWIKTGAMVGYSGEMKFVRERILEFGAKKAFKKFFTTEGATLTDAQGVGQLYLADEGKKISLIQLNDETIFVNGADLLAFEKNLQWDIQFLKQMGAWMSGGLFNVKISGKGLVAISTHYDPLTLPVNGKTPVFTDPNATVAWSGGVTPSFKTDIQLKTFFGRGSGESIQMTFAGQGFVVIQPFEEAPIATHNQSNTSNGSPATKLAGFAFALVVFAVGLIVEFTQGDQLKSLFGDSSGPKTVKTPKIRPKYKRNKNRKKLVQKPAQPVRSDLPAQATNPVVPAPTQQSGQTNTQTNNAQNTSRATAQSANQPQTQVNQVPKPIAPSAQQVQNPQKPSPATQTNTGTQLKN